MNEKLYEMFKEELKTPNTFNEVTRKFNELSANCEQALIKAMDERMNLLEEELESLRIKKGDK